MKYENFQLKDFVNDAFFNNWVKKPDQDSSLFWQNWIAQHPGKEDLIEEAKQLVLFLSFKATSPAQEDFMEVKAAIKSQIRQQATQAPNGNSGKEKKNTGIFLPQYRRIAAVLIGFLLVCGGIYYLAFQPATHTTYATRYGETKTIQLPDGSTVIVNANSSVRFANAWESAQDREVWLTGEAFFEVQRKKSPKGNTRFIVHTEGLNVEVLGTTFNVRNRRGIVKVVLNSGKVQLNQQGESKKALTMKPGELVEFSEKNSGFTKRAVKPENYTSWRYNKLIFEETPVREIAQMLEDDYGVKVSITSPAIANRKFTGSVPKGNIDILLTVLAESLNISITHNPDEVILDYK